MIDCDIETLTASCQLIKEEVFELRRNSQGRIYQKILTGLVKKELRKINSDLSER